jgi:hypothetical protein
MTKPTRPARVAVPPGDEFGSAAGVRRSSGDESAPAPGVCAISAIEPSAAFAFALVRDLPWPR